MKPLGLEVVRTGNGIAQAAGCEAWFGKAKLPRLPVMPTPPYPAHMGPLRCHVNT